MSGASRSRPVRKLMKAGTVPDLKLATGSGPKPTQHHVLVAALQNFLAHKGIGCDRKRGDPFSLTLERLQSTPGYVSTRDLIENSAKLGKSSVIIKALLGRLVMPDFTTFARNLQAAFHIAQAWVDVAVVLMLFDYSVRDKTDAAASVERRRHEPDRAISSRRSDSRLACASPVSAFTHSAK